MKRRLLYALGAFGLGLVVAISLLDPSWGGPVVAICIVYAVVVSVFLGIQVIGLLFSQASYSDVIEAPKFTMLANEDKE